MKVFGYTEHGMIRAEIDGVEMFIPDDMGNRHRQMIAEWEAEGNSIPAYQQSVPPMPVLTQRQLWLAALQAGITEEMVVAAVSQIPDIEEREWTLIEIRKSQDYVYTHPAIDKIRMMMGLPEEQFKVTWRWAATL